ncbi:MAPEG family protein [Parasphingorhabdus sp.]|uniref:MAPEG family protein n=1 Tax=Parasphingorhabdus sp. TaxID=2709688 RepID=UPI003266BC06
MTVPIISAYAGGLLIIMQALLMVTVGLHRGKSGVSLGLGDDPVLERKIRRHGNLAENAAIFIVVLALAEITVVPGGVIKTIAIVFLAARLFHAIAMSTVIGSHGGEGSKVFVVARVLGALGTFGSFLALGGFLLYHLV